MHLQSSGRRPCHSNMVFQHAPLLDLRLCLPDGKCRAGVAHGTVEVRFQNLTVEAPIGVGTSGLPSITNTYLNLVFVSLSASGS